MTRWIIVADLNRCVGCQTCTSACKHANATAPGVQWRKVLDFETGEYPDVRRAFLPAGCMHCDEPPCMDVCPSTATGKRADGIVTIDYDLCIGCAYCAVACPYQARFRVDRPASAYAGKRMRHEIAREDPHRIGVAQKCTFCLERIDAGLAAGLTPGLDEEATPACVNSCIAGALHFGDADDPDSNVSRLLAEHRHFRMHEDLQTGPGIYYLWEQATEGETAAPEETAPPPMAAEPVGMDAVSPRRQTNWDWRAAANFIAGGTGAGLFAATALAGLFVPPPIPAAGLLALALVAAGLFCVWLEIGRPWRFINVYFNARRSWMTREALAALPFFALGGGAALSGSPPLWLGAAAFGLLFLYCQARILRAARGIPAWRQAGIVPLIVDTGLSEGTGIFAVFAAASGNESLQQGSAMVLLILLFLRYAAWRLYRRALGNQGAPVQTFRTLDQGWLNLHGGTQLVIAAITAAGLMMPALLAAGGIAAAVTGWAFKYTLITRAAFTQGYAIARMPARGAGTSAPGIKPGWMRS